MTSGAPADDHVSFPRRQARTQRFTLGVPRTFTVSDDGSRVAFLRSHHGEDPVNRLWLRDVDSGEERVLADPADLLDGGDDGNLPAAERARRERAREAAGGIVGYDKDESLQRFVFALGGRIFRADADADTVIELPVTGAAFDPRLSPDGGTVSYVSGSTLRCTGDDGDREVIAEPGDTVTWGSAEFVAGEEMGRTRGHWWAPDGRQLAVARVDTAPVAEWWIASPVDPSTSPHAIRYPAAGTSNAEVGLAVVGLDGSRVDVDWAADDRWEYLADVSWSAAGLILTVQSRDQRALAVIDVDPATGACSERHRVTDEHWVELVPGAPVVVGDRLVMLEDRPGARRLCVDGTPLTPADVQVRSVVRAADDGVIVTAGIDSTEVHVASVGWDGELRWLTDRPGVHGASAGGDTLVITRRALDLDGVETAVLRRGEPAGVIDSFGAPLGIDVRVELRRVGARELATAVLRPDWADPGRRLPVLLDPYGGPHAQRVQAGRGLFATSQWFADQGFVVIVTDGRGTPGRGPEFEREVWGDLAEPVLQDQIDALDAVARSTPGLDLDRVAIRGWSFGGYLAALAVLRRPERFHAAIAGAPVTDWRLYDTHYTERYLGHPDIDAEHYERTDLTADAARLERPLLLIHGLADDNVVAAHTLGLSQALMEAGRPHQVLPLSGVTHMTPQEEVAENLMLLQLAFLRDALGTPPGA